MELKKIKIENYKSIKSVEINFKKINNSYMYVFFGKNGTGKSNFLKAINLLNEDTPCDYFKEKHKNINQKIRIYGEFILNKKEIEIFKTEIKKIIHKEIFDSMEITGFSIQRLVDSSEENSSHFPYLIFKLKNEKELSEKYIVRKVDEIERILLINHPKNIKEEEKLNYSKLEKFIFNSLKETYIKLSPKVIFWTSKDEYLITKGGDLKDFLENPNSNIPLRNAFLFSGYKLNELKEQIEEIKENDPFRGSIQRKISNKITKHLNEIWKDGKIRFELTIERGLNWYVSISDDDEDDTVFGMGDRSDGFRQLVSILLTLSIEKRLNKLKNKIILIDEPETHLYPLSIEYLRDELIEMGDENFIFISSHSIFILDYKAYDRHFKVSKEKLITSIDPVNKNNLHELELLYNCLGTSLYKIVTPNVLILEGMSDVVIFDSFVEKFKDSLEIINIKSLPSFGEGDFEKYLSFSNEKIINAFSLLDFDKGGHGRKVILQEKFPDKKNKIFDIKDILEKDNLNRDKIVLEDLLPKEMIEEVFKEVYGKEINLEKNNESYSTQMTNFLNKEMPNLNRMEKQRQIQLKKVLSEKIVQEVSDKDDQEVKDKFKEYFEFFKKFCKKIK